jgi:glycosyltransferase 2 family protein
LNSGTPAPRPASRRGAILRLIVAVALVVYFFARANPRAVIQAFSQLAAAPLLTVVALVLVDRGLMAYRWFVLLRPLERERLPPFSVILETFFVSTFLGTFLPGSIGGDAVRAYSLSAHGVPIGDSMASVFVDRMLGILSLLLMALLSVSLARDLASDRAVVAGLAAATTACLVAAMFVFSEKTEAAFEGLLSRVPRESIRRVPAQFLSSIRRYASQRGALVLVLATSIAVQVLRIVQAYYLGMALGLVQPPSIYFAFVPLILLVMLLPVTVNGIGTSQAAFVWLFGRAGTPAPEAFALSVLFVALQIVGNIPGAVFVITRTFSPGAPRQPGQ